MMDTAVALVQAYLHINGYFTVTEYPVVEAMKRGGHRTATDIDILAVRFPSAGRFVPGRGKAKRSEQFDPDPELCRDTSSVDMIIGEVKEGRAELNRGARNPDVLLAVLSRFGCCPDSHLEQSVQDLIRRGSADMPTGHRARLVAFGVSTGDHLGYPCEVMALSHVIRFTQEYLRKHWEVLRLAQFKESAFATLMILEKSRTAQA